MKLGIGVTTYNRAASLERCLDGIVRYTESPFVGVVADDGSTDATRYMKFPCFHFMHNANGGIARNKNRLLYRLFEIEKCTDVILIEDDVTPVKFGWDRKWVESSRRYGHINMRTGNLETHGIILGDGSVLDPYVGFNLSGQVMCVSLDAWRNIGYMDPRFKSYGYEHAEYSRRMACDGCGGFYQDDVYTHFLIDEPDVHIDHEIPTTGTPEKIAESFEVLKLTLGDEGYKLPWSSEEDRVQFLIEANR